MIKVGISGKIASGKSEAEKIIKEKGFFVFDLDIISHNLLENDKNIQSEILKEFKTINRKELSKIVFSDNQKKAKLENIIHPKLKKIIFELFEKYKNEKIIFISGALLFKSGFYKFFDKTIFINAKKEIRLERLIKRNNITEKEALLKIDAQDDNALADIIIENNDNFSNLKEKIEQTLNNILK